MEIYNLLIEALKERFKANVIVEAIETKIVKIAENITFEKYKNTPLFNDGMEFELVGVIARVYTFQSDINPRKIDLRLAYFCKSNLRKEKRLKLEKVKCRYEKDKFLESCNYKISVWKELSYQVEVEKFLSNCINLDIS
jgi:hypothetical protein